MSLDGTIYFNFMYNIVKRFCRICSSRNSHLPVCPDSPIGKQTFLLFDDISKQRRKVSLYMVTSGKQKLLLYFYLFALLVNEHFLLH